MKRIGARALILALCAGGLSVDGARAACELFPFSMTRPVVERFIFKPSSIYVDFPQAGEDLSYRVMVLGSSSRASLGLLLYATRQANHAQREAIAIGLARASRRCEARFHSYSRIIDQTVKQSASPDFNRVYRRHLTSSGLDPLDESERARAARGGLDAKPAQEPDKRTLPSISLQPGRAVPDISPVGPPPR